MIYFLLISLSVFSFSNTYQYNPNKQPAKSHYHVQNNSNNVKNANNNARNMPPEQHNVNNNNNNANANNNNVNSNDNNADTYDNILNAIFDTNKQEKLLNEPLNYKEQSILGAMHSKRATLADSINILQLLTSAFFMWAAIDVLTSSNKKQTWYQLKSSNANYIVLGLSIFFFIASTCNMMKNYKTSQNYELLIKSLKPGKEPQLNL